MNEIQDTIIHTLADRLFGIRFDAPADMDCASILTEAGQQAVFPLVFSFLESRMSEEELCQLDYLPEDKGKRERLRKTELFWVRMAQHAAELSPGNGKTIKQRVLKNLAFICSRFFVAGNILRRMHVRYMRLDQKPTKYIGVPWSPELFEAAWFDDAVEIEFEGHAFLAPAETDKVLTACYGDYMQLPPEKDRVYKHHLECYERD